MHFLIKVLNTEHVIEYQCFSRYFDNTSVFLTWGKNTGYMDLTQVMYR